MEPRVYYGHDRKAVEVEIDGTWYPGELRAWLPKDGEWTAEVMWTKRPGENYLTGIPADRVRLVEDDGRLER